jgi:hypothetical protein
MTDLKRTNARLIAMMALAALVLTQAVAAYADSTTIDGPGFKVEKKNGWFGRKSTVYQDALGNRVEKKTGLFGRTSTKSKMFGSEAVKKGNDMTVTGPNGEALVTQKKTLFGGKQTHVDGNGIFQSLKGLFQ